MSNVSIERMVDLKPVSLSLKLSVNNLFNEEYLSVFLPSYARYKL